MLEPHACHNVVYWQIMNGKELLQEYYFCLDCEVNCHEDGSDIGHYFDFKERGEYCLEGIKEFINRMYEIKMKSKKFKDTDMNNPMEDVRMSFNERNPNFDKKPQ